MNLTSFTEVKRRINMYCENCGTQMNLGKFCPKCGYDSQSNKTEEKTPQNEPIDILPVYNPMDDVPTFNPVKKEKPLTKCIWFAPVTTVVLAISLSIFGTLPGTLISFLTPIIASEMGTDSSFGISYLSSGISSSINNILTIIIILLISFGLYALAFKKRFKNHIPMVFLPYASYLITCTFVNIFTYPIYGVINYFINYGNIYGYNEFSDFSFITSNVVSIILSIARVVFITIIAVGISTLIAVKYLKKAEETRKKLEEYEEKAEETIE